MVTLMKKIEFIKLVASGNDFILFDLRQKSATLNLKEMAKQICSRKFGIGADGLLVLGSSKKADVKMRIFNADGSEAQMCGNGARCTAYFIAQKRKITNHIEIETKAGILEAKTHKDDIKIKMTDPKNIKLDFMIRLNKHPLRLSFINTGVPHIVILCEEVEEIDVYSLGRLIRYHKRFKPEGSNVNFIEPKGLDHMKIRTYERGVEQETLACGTGSVAAAIIYALKLKKTGLLKENKVCINADTVSGETLRISFDLLKNKIRNIWLEGKARIICKGEYHV